jgi:hypothetical protein
MMTFARSRVPSAQGAGLTVAPFARRVQFPTKRTLPAAAMLTLAHDLTAAAAAPTVAVLIFR